MALVTALLCRYSLGYRWTTDAAGIAAYGRREGYLELGAVTSATEVDRVASAIFSTRATPHMAVSASLEPVDDTDTPYSAFTIGDYVTLPDVDGSPVSMRVVAFTVTEDTEGNPFFTPEFGSLRDEREREIERSIKRLSNGTLGGTVESATPATPPPALPEKKIATTGFVFSQPGAVASITSGRWYPAESCKATELVASLVIPAIDDLTVNFLRDDTIVDTLVIPAGDNRAWKSLASIPFTKINWATVESVVGTDGGTELVVLVRVTR